MADVKVRRMEARDLGVVKALHRRFFPVSYPAAYFKSLLRESYVSLVATRDSRVVGCAVGYERTWPRELGEAMRVGYVSTFGVSEEVRRLGVGSRLLRRLARELRSKLHPHALVLETAHENEAAQRFYEAHEFRMLHRLPGHYEWGGEKHDALRFVLPLTNFGADVLELETLGWLRALLSCWWCRRRRHKLPSQL